LLFAQLASERSFDVVKGLDAIPLDGCPFLDETVFFHRPTRSLIGADILISACARDHWSWRWAARLTVAMAKSERRRTRTRRPSPTTLRRDRSIAWPRSR